MLKKEITEFIKSPIGKWVVRALVVLVATGGIVMAEKFINNDKTDNEAINTPPQQEQQVETPGAVNTMPETKSEIQIIAEIKETIPTAESLELDESLKTDPEKLAIAIEEGMMTDWINAGATPENARKWLGAKNKAEREAIFDAIVKSYDDIYIDALFTEDWQSYKYLADEIESIKRTHDITLGLYFATALSDENTPYNKEPYRRGIKVTEMRIFSQDYFLVGENNIASGFTVTRHEYDNAENNRVGLDDAGVKEIDTTSTIGLTVINNKIKINSYRPGK